MYAAIRKSILALLMVLPGVLLTRHLPAQQMPKETDYFGFNIGDNYKLATYTQTEKYWKAIAAAAPDRVKMVDIGKTEDAIAVVGTAGRKDRLVH